MSKITKKSSYKKATRNIMAPQEKIAPLIENILKAILNQNAEALETHMHALDILFLEIELFPDQPFNSILESIRMPTFQNFKKSWLLLAFFNDSMNIEKLSTQQRTTLIHVLVEIYSFLIEPTACLVAVEIIINLCSKEQSLEILCKLQKVQSNVARALTAYGFRYFIQQCSDNSLRQRALQSLSQMKHDSSEDVRRAVNDALARLQVKETR